ncbi:N-acetylglucosamine kinase [Tenacibaculum sp. S7007]|uniref:N-acetylglucosamine kinase n=1 Tax=Tenacibaculum pelagium TaxID=2759527 RepID=A0A839AMK0_9FLAO|nr:N-acetylglucosamine kinase [Tenacibaculum pelagium]MBA6156313.1 N-acetylglucosamine kinase [Tenacibaculum pelagium]
MILIADGGSTKVDWILLNSKRKEVSRVKTYGLNPSVIEKKELLNIILGANQLIEIKKEVSEVHFYGAGCGTKKPVQILRDVMKSVFVNAGINISEDMLGAVYASSRKKPAIVCILGTGSNSCYFDGFKIKPSTPSLGYTIMDEASGNYFGKILLKHFFYKKMPGNISENFKNEFNLDVDTVKRNLYRESNPAMYLASFAKFMFDYKESKYIQEIIKNGFQKFFEYRVLPFDKDKNTPIYFIGSIAFYFKDILEQVALDNNLIITDVIQRPIDRLVEYHQNLT